MDNFINSIAWAPDNDKAVVTTDKKNLMHNLLRFARLYPEQCIVTRHPMVDGYLECIVPVDWVKVKPRHPGYPKKNDE